MELNERKVGNVTVVDVSGKFTGSDGGGRLKDKVTSLVFQGEKAIVLNLAKLSHLDSSGLGEIVACHTTASRSGGEVKIASAGGRIHDLLIMTKLLTVFDTHDTEQEAVASFGAQESA